MTMEAMKMELSLTAPRDGKVASVTVVAGDQVNEGILLVELEYDPEKWEPVFGEDHTQTKTERDIERLATSRSGGRTWLNT